MLTLSLEVADNGIQVLFLHRSSGVTVQHRQRSADGDDTSTLVLGL